MNDVLYRADGNPARGTVTIRWNGFTASDGSAVAAGVLTVKIGANGSFNVQLVPNTGAKPEGSYYKVVMKLDDGTTSEEAWAVPAAPTTTVAAVRATVMPASAAVQHVGRDYVDSAVAAAVTNNVQTNGSYADPVWLSSLSSSKLVGTLPQGVLPATVVSANAQNTFTQPQTFANINGCRYAGQVGAGTIQAAINDAGSNGCVIIPRSYAGADAFTNPSNISVTDYRRGVVQAGAINLVDLGAVADGVTDIGAKLQSAMTTACTTGGTVVLPCAGAGCYLANATALPQCSNYSTLRVELAGKLILGTTLVTPNRTAWVGKGGSGNAQFQASNASATIVAPQVKGTVGTAVATGSQIFTPTFTSGSIAQMPAGSAITVAGNTTCAISSITRASNIVTATLAGSCRIPAGTTVTVAGVTDSSFNTTPMVIASDFPAQTVTWSQAGSNGTSAGGTVTGFNEDSFETVRITAVNGSTVTATFLHPHSSSDVWGMVGVIPMHDTFDQHSYENLNVMGNWGAGFWSEHTAFLFFKNVGLSAQGYAASIPMELASTWWFNIDKSSLLPSLGHFCGSNCGQQSFPAGLRITGITNPSNDGSGGMMSSITGNTVIGGGVKVDTNGIYQSMGGTSFSDVTIEQPFTAAVVMDWRSANQMAPPIVLNNVFLQDNFMGYSPTYLANEDFSYSGSAEIRNMSDVVASAMVNKYFGGRLLVNGIAEDQGKSKLTHGRYTPEGTIIAGNFVESELRGIGANLGPAVVPYATLNVPSDISAWPLSGSCSMNSGQLAPDGTATASVLSGTDVNSYFGQFLNLTTHSGDWFIFGAWVKNTGGSAVTGSAFGGLLQIHSFGSNDVFDATGTADAFSTAYESKLQNDWWHPVVMMAKLKAGDGGSHTYNFRAYCSGQNGVNNTFWAPFIMQIPASANVPLEELERWRQQLLHGFVPPSMPAGSLAVNPTSKLYFGSDVNLYRGGANQLKTDATIAASNIGAAAGLATSGNATRAVTTSVQNDTAGQTACWDGAHNVTNSGCAGGAGGVSVVGKIAPTTYSGTAGPGAVALYTPTSAGQFRICGNYDVTVAGTGGNVYIYASYTSDGHPFTPTLGVQLSLASQWNTSNGCATFYADANTAISATLALPSAAGTPSVRYAVSLERLQ